MKILMLVTRNQLLSQKIISWHKKSSLVTRNQFLPQEIHSYHKKSILVKRNQFLWSHILWLNFFINTQQRVKPTKKFAWMLTFRGNLVPRFPGNLPPCLCLSRVPWSHFCCIECKNITNNYFHLGQARKSGKYGGTLALKGRARVLSWSKLVNFFF